MNSLARVCVLIAGLLLCLSPAAPQRPSRGASDPEMIPDTRPGRLPNGKSQAEELLKSEYEKSLQDASQLVELAEQLKIELEKNDRHILSVSSLKKTDEIEKIVKRLRGRIRKF